MRYAAILLTWSGMTWAISNGLITDSVIKPGDFAVFSPPANIGSTYVDPSFNTRVTRVTNCGLAHAQALGGYMGNSEICTFNSDGSYFIATENVVVDGKEINATYLYSGSTGARLKMLGKDTMRPWWIRWALAKRYKKNGQYVTIDPVYCFYKYEANEIRLYDVRQMESYVVLRRFSEYGEIGPAGGEGDLSDDGRYWCLDGDHRELFVYDLVDDIKYPASTFNAGVIGSPGSELGVDYAAVSPSGQYVVVSWSTTTMESRYHGIEVYDRQFNFQRQIYPGIIHWELGVDRFGHEVIYTTAGFALAEYYTSRGVRPGDLISIRLSDGYIRLLKRMEVWASQIMSACNSVTDHNYVYVALYGRSSDPNKLWAPFWGEIVEIPTDGSGQVRRLVHHRSREISGKSEKYWQPDLVVNRQGSKIVYRSTYLGPTADLYMFDVGRRDEAPVDEIPPHAPTGLKSSQQTFDTIRLSWDRPAQAADGDWPSFYRVYRNNVLLAEQVETSYTDTGLEEAGRYEYAVASVDKAGLVCAEPARATFATLADTEPPRLLYASITDRTHIRLTFSEPVSKSSAEEVRNYRIQPALAVQAAVLAAGATAVDISCSEMQLGTEYLISVSGISDQARQPNTMSQAIYELRMLADFFDDFESSATAAWTFHTPSRWQRQMDGGDQSLHLSATGYDSPDGKRLGEYALLESDRFNSRDFIFSCAARSAENTSENRYADYAIVFGYQDSLNYYYVQFHTYDVVLSRIVAGEKEILAKLTQTVHLTAYQPITIQLQRDTCTVSINNQLVLQQAIMAAAAGQIGMGSFNDRCYFDDVQLEAFAKKDQVPPNSPQGLMALPLTR